MSICIFCFYVLYTYIFILIYKQGFWFNGYKEKLFSSQTAEEKTEQRNCFGFLDEAQYNVIPRAKFPHELGWSPDSFQDTYFKNFICEQMSLNTSTTGSFVCAHFLLNKAEELPQRGQVELPDTAAANMIHL